MIIFLICTPWADTGIFEEIWLKNQIQFLMKLNGPIRGFTKKGNFYETSSKAPLLQDWLFINKCKMLFYFK